MIEYWKNLDLRNLFYIDENGIMQEEEWRDVIGFESLYQDSNLGRVKALDFECYNGKATFIKKGKIRRLTIDKKGYLAVCLYKDKKMYTRKVHRLIGASFIENPENKPQINHKDGVKTNNKLSNLEWCTNSENGKHAHRTGLRIAPKGAGHHKSKLNDEDVFGMRDMYLNKSLTIKSIADFYGVSKSTIAKVVSKRAWKHI